MPSSHSHQNPTTGNKKLSRIEAIFLLTLVIFLTFNTLIICRIDVGISYPPSNSDDLQYLEPSSLKSLTKSDRTSISAEDVGHANLENQNEVNNPATPIEQNIGYDHKLGGLSCAAFGGPSDEVASEMVYWSDIPDDSHYESPFKQNRDDGTVQYMTFEPDGGGWNNIR